MLSAQIGAAAGAQYLTFRLGDEEYGLEILKVQEIRSYSAITPLPNTPREIGRASCRERVCNDV